uniref:Uncharacterized protein n=1 Tax=Arundo donax TaxID=35708 RepID=A0A0A9CGG9_ARUDO
MDIPNFAAAFGKCPRSIIPKEMFLLEYILESSGRTLLACIHVAENEVRNSTSQNRDVGSSVSRLSSCNGVK